MVSSLTPILIIVTAYGAKIITTSQIRKCFLTICTYASDCVFGEAVEVVTVLNEAAEMAQSKWHVIATTSATLTIGVLVWK